MYNSYWQDAQGRVYKVQGNEQPLTEGLTRINRDEYRKRIREQERARFALDSHTSGESANEVVE